MALSAKAKKAIRHAVLDDSAAAEIVAAIESESSAAQPAAPANDGKIAALEARLAALEAQLEAFEAK